MKSQEPTYKKFPFPVRILLSYIILSVTGIVLLDMLSMFLIVTDSVDGFLNTFLSIGLMLIAYAAGMLVFAVILSALCGRKIYRGIGLYRFTTVVSIACPIAFIGMIVFMNATNMTYSFFNIATLFFELAVPPVLMWYLRMFTRRCSWCGLINTYKVTAVRTDDLGREHKFHTEGGYYYEQKSTGRISEQTSVAPEVMDVEITTTQYVPKTTVYDGIFERKRTTTDFRCAVCGNIVKETTTTETRIGD
ncbi:MAG: hypothetical protein IJY24_02195 [Clostridia bacterium]|nr:hypothetical protein [Clostridia bacterium]